MKMLDALTFFLLFLTHEFSHAIDGLGYAYSDIYTANRQIKTFDKALLGL